MKTLALIAHDGRKAMMLDWARTHRDFLTRTELVATGTMGGLLESQIGLRARKMLSGPLGGDLQIGALIVTEQIEAVFFLRDPLTAHPHEPDIAALMKACDIHNVPLATNVASADMLIAGLKARFEATSPNTPL